MEQCCPRSAICNQAEVGKLLVTVKFPVNPLLLPALLESTYWVSERSVAFWVLGSVLYGFRWLTSQPYDDDPFWVIVHWDPLFVFGSLSEWWVWDFSLLSSLKFVEGLEIIGIPTNICTRRTSRSFFMWDCDPIHPRTRSLGISWFQYLPLCFDRHLK